MSKFWVSEDNRSQKRDSVPVTLGRIQQNANGCMQNNKQRSNQPLSPLIEAVPLHLLFRERAVCVDRSPTTRHSESAVTAPAPRPTSDFSKCAVVQSELCFIDLFQGSGKKITWGLLPVRNNNGAVLRGALGPTSGERGGALAAARLASWSCTFQFEMFDYRIGDYGHCTLMLQWFIVDLALWSPPPPTHAHTIQMFLDLFDLIDTTVFGIMCFLIFVLLPDSSRKINETTLVLER